MKQWLLDKRYRVIAAGVLVAALPLACLALYAYGALTQNLQRTKLDEHRALADHVCAHLEEKLDGDVAFGTSYAARLLFIRALLADDRSELERHLRSLVETSGNIERALVTSPQGIILADYPAALPSVIGEDRSSKDWYRAVSKGWRPYVSEYYLRGALPKRYLFAIAIPVLSEGGRPAGIIVLQPKKDYVQKEIGRLGASFKGLLVYVVDKKGNLIYHPDDELKGIVDFSGAPPVRKLLAGFRGAELYFDPLRRERVLGAYQQGSTWGWGVVVQTAWSEIAAPAHPVMIGFLVATLVLTAGGGVLAYRAASLFVEMREVSLERREERDRAQKYLDVAGVMLTVLDTSGKVSMMNPKGCEILGYPTEKIVGSDWFEHFLPERMRAEVREVFAKLMRGEIEPVEYYESPVLSKDAGERILSFHNAVIRDHAGEIIGIMFSGADVTESKLVEERLRASSEYNRSLIEASLDPLVTIGRDGRITDVNHATEEATGYQKDDLVGMDFCDYFTEPEQARTGYLKAFLEGAVRDYPLLLRHRDGRTTPVLYNASIYRDAKGAVIGVFAAARDISEQQRAAEELRGLNEELERRVAVRTSDLESKSGEIRESQHALMNLVEDLNAATEELRQANLKLQDVDRLKSMFIASMSHELRTPLNSIIGFSSIMLEEWVGPLNDEQKKNMATVLRSGRHLLTLINDVIDVSKIEAGKLESTAEDFDLQGVVAESVALLKNEAEQKGLVLEIAAAPQIVHSDRRRLLQCLVNLVGNAVKFTERGRVSVRTRLVKSRDGAIAPERVEIEVRDTGIGLREEDLAKLFVAFVRISSPLSATVKGTGLGLYLVRKIAEGILMGEVTASSTYQEGSSFRLTIPLILPQGEGQ